MRTLRTDGSFHIEEISSPSTGIGDSRHTSPAQADEAPPAIQLEPSLDLTSSLHLLENNLESARLESHVALFNFGELTQSSPFCDDSGLFDCQETKLPLFRTEAQAAEESRMQAVLDALNGLGTGKSWPGSKANGGAPDRSDFERAMTGVVIWPHELNTPIAQVLDRQSAYGKHLDDGVSRAAEAIRRCEIRGLPDLWKFAREVRVTAPGFKGEVGFFSPRFPEHANLWLFSEYAYTPLDGPYLYLRERLVADKNFVSEGELMSKSISWHIPDESGQSKLVCLTRFSTAVDGSKKSPYWGASGLLWRPQIVHTAAVLIPEVMLHAGRLYEQAFMSPSEAEFRDMAAKVYWWLAHAMPDKRGSAAKAEICFRAMHAARGLSCPLWRPGVSADIEAMLRTEEQWLAEYPQLQWSAQELQKEIQRELSEDKSRTVHSTEVS